MSVSNIDDLLMSEKTSTQPEAPEHQYLNESDSAEEMESEKPVYDIEEVSDINVSDENANTRDDVSNVAPKLEVDEYGNEKEPENEAIRERLSRQARKYEAEINALRQQLSSQGASQEVQKAAKDFEYDPQAQGDWQQQLASFVKQTVNSMTREEQEEKRKYQEEQSQIEFRDKFRRGMEKFDDFIEIVDGQPLDDAMTIALRAMDDPAAFIYAAAKRNPEELQRISKLRDPYARIVEMGKLEERMRRNKPTTKAPRPLGRAQEDAILNLPKKQQDFTGDDLLAKADAKRLNTVKQRHKINR